LLRSGREYLNGLADGRRVYYRGAKVADVTQHPLLGVAARHTAVLFDLHQDAAFQPSLMAEDPETKEPISALYRRPGDEKQLGERSEIIQATTRHCRAVFNIMKVIGSDALFGLATAAAETDRQHGTHYSQNVSQYHGWVAREDRGTVVAQTDVKGDRSLRPSRQRDPDLYVRIKERRPEGIVVRGAKVHITQPPVADEIIVIPSRAMTEADADYAVAFAVPANVKGLTMICRPLIELEGAKHPLEGPRVRHNALVEALMVFDDVFVPWERVFLAGESAFAGRVAHMFALWHRFSAVSYRSAQADLIAALALELAEANGIVDKSHIRRNIVELIQFAEIQRMSAQLAALKPARDPLTGGLYPNPLYVNVGKLYSNAHYLSAVQALIDCAGGLAITAPSGDDYANPELRPVIEKYMAGNAEVGGDKRFKLFLVARELVALLGGLESVTMVHAEGSIEASVIELLRTYDFTSSRALLDRILL
jgi:4-hydroxybutyryl-CoA dehydratase / vinylacetyl-CoA-Delta-isomerase